MDDVFYKDVFFSSLQKTSKIAKIEQARDGYTPQKSTSSKRLASVPPDKKPQTPLSNDLRGFSSKIDISPESSLDLIIIVSLFLIAAGACTPNPQYHAPVAPPLNAHCTIQNHKKDLVCVVNGEPIIARIYR
jgi:hypothetical protein